MDPKFDIVFFYFSFHMTFPSICCADAHVDAMDVTGEQQVNVLQSILKQRYQNNSSVLCILANLIIRRLDSRGYPIGREFVDNDQSPKMCKSLTMPMESSADGASSYPDAWSRHHVSGGNGSSHCITASQ